MSKKENRIKLYLGCPPTGSYGPSLFDRSRSCLPFPCYSFLKLYIFLVIFHHHHHIPHQQRPGVHVLQNQKVPPLQKSLVTFSLQETLFSEPRIVT